MVFMRVVEIVLVTPVGMGQFRILGVTTAGWRGLVMMKEKRHSPVVPLNHFVLMVVVVGVIGCVCRSFWNHVSQLSQSSPIE